MAIVCSDTLSIRVASRSRRRGLALLTVLLILVCSVVASSAPSISNISLSSNEVGRYDVLEISAEISTSATNFDWPYDTNTPASIPSGTGVAVTASFSNDNWATSVTTPGFYYQEYERRIINGAGLSYGDEAITPVGAPHWLVRFSPTATGIWKYKISVTDKDGSATSPEGTFTCIASQHHGFPKVSGTDPRYFELTDGTHLISSGMYSQFHSTYEADSLLQTYGQNGIKLTRWWMNFREWQNPFGGGASNPQWDFSLAMSITGGAGVGDRYCARINTDLKHTDQDVYLFAGRLYRLTGYIRTADVTAEAGYGASIYIGRFPGAPLSRSAYVTGTTGWTKFTVDYTPASTGGYAVVLDNSGTGGIAYFDDLSLRASTDGGITWSGEYLSKGDFDFQNYVDQREAWKVDHILRSAQSQGVYLKTVISDCGDYTLGAIKPDGTVDQPTVSNFYASANHPSRWLQKAWWRYMTARWGAYRSLHSWELCNEGNPTDGQHWDAANAMANEVHSVYQPRHVMCTTSFWHSVPMDFWKTTSCDYLDLHEYFGPVTPGTESHGPRMLSWADAIHGTANEVALMPASNAQGIYAYDTGVRHAGSKSVKISPNTGEGLYGRAYCPFSYHIGIDPTHTYTVRFWAKAQDVGNQTDFLSARPGVDVTWSRLYHENDSLGGVVAQADLGTYDWKQFTLTGIRPVANGNTANITVLCSVKQSGTPGTFWIDDLEFIDETTGQDLYIDGGFEGERIDYDAALAVQKYGALVSSYGSRVAKPGIWAETGIRGANLYGDPYKGFEYQEENQQLVDDTSGIYLKKMIWANAGPGSPYWLYWWSQVASGKGFWGLFKAFQMFVADIPVSNGHYKDAVAVASDNRLRAWGQKDLQNNRAHLWIDNAPYTWKSVVDSINVPAVTGTVTLGGLRDGRYKIEWWNTTTGAVANVEELTCTGGSLALSIQNLQSDIACKIAPAESNIDLDLTVPSAEVVPGQNVTITVHYTNTGETEAKNVSVQTQVPAQMTYVAGSAEATGGSYDAATRNVSWVIASVGAKQGGDVTFVAKVN